MDATLSLVLFEAVLILLAIAISKAIRLISPLDDSCKDVVHSIPTVSSPPHVVSAPTATKYDVFLSFRGEDTRDTFASSLYEALCNANIHTFMDHKLHKGQDIAPILLKTIKKSEISLIIFSKDYASSTWCMDELVRIMKCRNKYGRIVIPVFYHVDPSNIRKQTGSFGDGFAKLKFRFKHSQSRVEKWQNALIQSTKLSGWDSKNIRPESELIKKIVEDILSKLNTKSSFDVEGLVGIDHQIQKIEELLSEARIVGIWGMGGIGKTTLATTVFHMLKEQFEAFSFVGNVRNQLERIGLEELQKKCLQELLKDEGVNVYNFKSTFVKNRLRRKKILLILDDVNNSIEIEDLIKVCDWFGEGSRIIITSRDMQVLRNTSASTTFHVPQLDSHQALHLFSLKAFKQNEPSKSYLELSKGVVDYCGGNPLALKVLGCFLHGRGKEEWESAMEKLNQTLHKDIFNVLKLSFDGLDDTQQNVFLDLAFFLNEAWRIFLEDCVGHIYDPSARIDIGVLKERSLISVHKNDDIEMHALLMDMGLEISRQHLKSNPEKPIRLWKHEDIYNFFHNGKGIEDIRCLSLDLSKIRRRTAWRTSNFRKMHNLIFLKVHKSDNRKPSELTICDNLDYLPEELRFLSWEEYPFPHWPLHFCWENLIMLSMPNSNMRQLWNGNQHFPNLKNILLPHSKHLDALPDLSHVPKIERVNVWGCVKLDQIHSSAVLSNLVGLWVNHDGPRQINIGGSMKGTRSGLVMVYNYLDLVKSSWNEVRMKVLVCGDIICSVGFKHVEMPLAEIAELRYLLPFVREVGLSEGPIEYGHDFGQHYDYYCYHRYPPNVVVGMGVRRRGDRGGERHVVEPLTSEIINDHHHQISMEAREGGEEQEENEELMSSNATIFTRIPNSINGWSLLTKLRLRQSDSILKSLSLSLSPASCKPRVVATVSLHIPPSAFTDPRGYYDFYLQYDGWRVFGYRVSRYMTLVTDFVVLYSDP
ncbi:hypothetical protein QN277_005600 [Acacia crassicarpa]|uniref:TIR domain-containing protein n=1 Tax=Acacia crassicarpa TaxID=499986 RepID=A0AAE1M9Z2_9FABA|nr:hypothetical protein QN277_005600 [Acacia crassicarpa]